MSMRLAFGSLGFALLLLRQDVDMNNLADLFQAISEWCYNGIWQLSTAPKNQRNKLLRDYFEKLAYDATDMSLALDE